MKTSPEFVMVRPEHCSPSPLNPRKFFDPARIEDMASSIRALNAVEEPIKLRPVVVQLDEVKPMEFLWRDDRDELATRLGVSGDYLRLINSGKKPVSDALRREILDVSGFWVELDAEGHPTGVSRLEIVFGERRWRGSSAVVAGDAENEARPEFRLPAMVQSMRDAEVLKVQLIENVERAELTPMEEAQGYQLWLDLPENNGRTIDDLAAEFGRARATIARRLQLLQIPEKWREKIQSGGAPEWLAGVALKAVKAKGARAKDADEHVEKDLADALQVASEYERKEDAERAIERRFGRPREERRRWDVVLCNFEAEKWDLIGLPKPRVDVDLWTWEESRNLFPSGTTEIPAGHDYADAESYPQPHEMGPGHAPHDRWGELAERYEVALALVQDGDMKPRLIVKKMLVIEAAKLFHRDDPEKCPFRVNRAATKKALDEKRKADQSAGEDLSARVSRMLDDLETAIRARVNAGQGDDAMLAKCTLFSLCWTRAVEGAGPIDWAFAARSRKLRSDAGAAFADWDGCAPDKPTRAGLESLMVCAWTMHRLNDWISAGHDDPEACPDWVAISKSYGAA